MKPTGLPCGGFQRGTQIVCGGLVAEEHPEQSLDFDDRWGRLVPNHSSSAARPSAVNGDDIARSVGVPWEISERDMLLFLREAAEVAPAYVRADIDHATDICVALQIPDARPYVIHVHDGVLEMRVRRADDRPMPS